MFRVFQLVFGWSRIAVRGQFFYLILQKNHNVKKFIAQPLFFTIIILSYLSFYLFIFYHIYLFIYLSFIIFIFFISATKC
ncbi:hypothetical protein IGK23_002844 [Enterococcus sp. DIV1368c]